MPPSPLEKAKNGSEPVVPSAVEGALIFSLQGQAAGKPRRAIFAVCLAEIARDPPNFMGHLERSGIAAESKFYCVSEAKHSKTEA